MIRLKCLPWLVCASSLLPGIAGAAEADSKPQEKPQPVLETQGQPRSLDERIARVESLLQNHAALLSLLKEVETLKAELSRLRGKDETQDHQLESLGKRQSDLYVDLDKRVDDLGKQLKTASQQQVVQPVVASAGPATQASPPKQAAPAEPLAAGQSKLTAADSAGDPLAESRSYETALNLFRSGSYAKAISDFGSFLKAYPDSTLAPNAQYWTGYAYYATKDYKNSLEHQRKLVSTWPQSTKVPDAMLNIASNQVELNDLASAKKNLEEIVSKYPGTNAAAIAAKRLALLK